MSPARPSLTAGALLTRRKIAAYILEHQAHYVFTAKENQPTLCEAIRLIFARRAEPDFCLTPYLAHGRIEQRSIWLSTRLNDHLDFPGVGQVFAIQCDITDKRSGDEFSTETAYGLTSHSPQGANAAQVLAYNRGHWSIENGCHYALNWNWDEDRSTIRSGHDPENMTALHRFANGIIHAKSSDSVASTLQRLNRNVRMVFDYLRMTKNAQPRRHSTSANTA
ncbi:MAG: ISAs1 family transposase [Acidithiobacillus sp.]